MITRWIRPALAGLSIIAIAGASGCGRPTEGGPTQPAARRNAYVEDIAVPAGFSIDEGRSHSKTLASPRLRWVDHIYTGRGDALAVRNFYVLHMPETKWEGISETANEGVYTMRFKKGAEVCDITVSRGKLLGPVEIHVRLEPLQEGGTSPRQPQ